MRTNIKYILTMLVSILLVIGIAPMASAAESTPSVNVTVTSQSMGQGRITGENIVNVTEALIGGATQLLWMVPDHNIRVSKRALKRAKKVRVGNCAMNDPSTSEVIAKKTRHASVVIVLPGSCLKNEGRRGRIVGGFNWDVRQPAVLKMDPSIGKYRHVFNARKVRKTWVLTDKACANVIGGPVDVWIPGPVIQVPNESQLIYEGRAVADATAKVTLGLHFVCPNGAAITTTAEASASGHGEAQVRFTSATRGSALSGARQQALNSLVAVDTQAAVSATVKVTCGDNVVVPPPNPAQNVDLLEIDTVNDVLVNNERFLTVRGTVSRGSAALFCAAGTGTITAGKSQTVSGNFNAQITYRAGDEPGADQVNCTLTGESDKDVITTNVFNILKRPGTPA